MHTPPLSTKEKFSYGLGDFASNLTFSTMSSYVLFYFTDYAGLSIAIAGGLLTFSRLLDAFLNPFTGILFDKTHSRFGKLRPYILYSTPVIILTFIACFFTDKIPMSCRAPFAFAMYLIFAVSYSLGNGAYTSLLTAITDNEKERLACNVAKNMGMSLGGIIASSCTLLFAKWIGFSATAILFGIVSFLALFLCFKNTRERVTGETSSLPLRSALKIMWNCKPFVLVCTLQFFQFTASITRSQNTVYYAKYILHNETIAAALLTAPTFVFFFVSPFLPKLVQRFGKRNVASASLVFSSLCVLAIWISGKSAVLVFIFNLLAGIGVLMASCIYFVQCIDTIDHAEWVSSYRLQGFMTSVMMGVAKLGIVFGTFLTPFILNLGGYTDCGQQSAATLLSIRIAFIIIPIVFMMITVFVGVFYKLDKQYPRILDALIERRKKH